LCLKLSQNCLVDGHQQIDSCLAVVTNIAIALVLFLLPTINIIVNIIIIIIILILVLQGLTFVSLQAHN